MNNKVYAAYGSNLHTAQMHRRCPDSLILGTGILRDYRLVFRGHAKSYGVATVIPCPGESVPVLLWSLPASDEQHLDFYEGFPVLYVKQTLEVELADNGLVAAMFYIMAPGPGPREPSPMYLSTIREGYVGCRFHGDTLKQALRECKKGARV